MTRTTKHMASLAVVLFCLSSLVYSGPLRAQTDAADPTAESTEADDSEADASEVEYRELERSLGPEICGEDAFDITGVVAGCTEPYHGSRRGSDSSEIETVLSFYPDVFSSEGERRVLVGVETSPYHGRAVYDALLFRKVADGWQKLDTADVHVRDCQPVTPNGGEPFLICASKKHGKNRRLHDLKTVRVDGETIEQTELLGFVAHNCLEGIQYCTPGQFGGEDIDLKRSAWKCEADPPVVVVEVSVIRVTDVDGCDADAPNCTTYEPPIMQDDGAHEVQDFRKQKTTMRLHYEFRDGRLQLADDDRPKVEMFEDDSPSSE